MANNPQFASTPTSGSASLSGTAETSYTAPTTAVTIMSAAAVTVASITTTSGSQLATAAGTIQSLQPNPAPDRGWTVIGTGIAPGTTVLAVQGTNLILSQPATASGTVSLTFICNGIKIDEVDVYGIGVTIAGMCQLYLHDGTNYHAFTTIAITGVTPSATVAPFSSIVPYDTLELPSGWSLRAASFVASQVALVEALGASL